MEEIFDIHVQRGVSNPAVIGLQKKPFTAHSSPRQVRRLADESISERSASNWVFASLARRACIRVSCHLPIASEVNRGAIVHAACDLSEPGEHQSLHTGRGRL